MVDAGAPPEDAGLVFPQSRFVAVTAYTTPGMQGDPAIATIREAGDGGSSILETWSPTLDRVGERRIAWSTMRVEHLASNRDAVTAIAGTTTTGFAVHTLTMAAQPYPTAGQSSFVSPGLRLARLRVLNPAPGLVDPVVLLTDGAPATEVGVRRMSMTSTTPAVISSSTQALADDVVEFPGNTLSVSARCVDTCLFNGMPAGSGIAGPLLRNGVVGFTPTTNVIGGVSRFTSVITNMGMPIFADTSATRIATDGNQRYLLAGQIGQSLRIERRLLVGHSTDAQWTSTGPLMLHDVMRSPRGDTMLVLASVATAGVMLNGVPIPWTLGTGRNVVLITVENSATPIGITTWPLRGDQEPVGFAHTVNPGIIVENRVIIVGNQGSDGFLWSVLHP